MNIHKLEAGLDLDVLVAERVMKLDVLGTASVNRDPGCPHYWMIPHDGRPGHGAFERPVYLDDCICEEKEDLGLTSDADYFGHHGMCLKVVPLYSTDIAAAWEVVSKWKYNWNIICDLGKLWADEEISVGESYRIILSYPGMPMTGVVAPTAPLAICRAALKAVGVHDTED